MRILMSLPWKGNIRELDNVLERAMILGDGEWIKPADYQVSGTGLKASPLKITLPEQSSFMRKLISSARSEGAAATKFARRSFSD